MGLLDAPATALDGLVRKWRDAGALAHGALPPAVGALDWPRGSSLVLQQDTAVELGRPTGGSLSLLLWCDDSAGELPRGVWRLGPELGDLRRESVPLARVVRVAASFDDDYLAYLALQAALHGVALDGVSVRSRPSSGQLWMRVSDRAADAGLTLDHLGAAIVRDIEAIEGVRSTAVLWICADAQAIALLEAPAAAAARLLGALVKRRTEDVADCGVCEFNDICEEGGRR